MTDEDLAKKIVSLGVGYDPDTDRGAWTIEDQSYHGWAYLDAGEFVRDWRVVGGLVSLVMETPDMLVEMTTITANNYIFRSRVGYKFGQQSVAEDRGSMARAICEACVEALTND